MNSKILKEFLNVYWLRPESAIWRALDTAIMKDFVFTSPSLDFGCGDGLFSFLRAGGGYDLAFDVYSDVNIHTPDYFKRVDVYDHFNPSTVIKSAEKPLYKIDVALDHKNNLLEKAKRLDFYRDFICHDANTKLPFSDNCFSTVFSNILYWLDKPHDVLLEINRILTAEGTVALMLPDKNFRNCSFYNKLFVDTADDDWKWLEKIDRGRMAENMKHMYNADEWETMFYESKFKVIKHRKHLSKQFISMWDIGLRPIFPLLYKMQSKLNVDDRLEIKKEWIELFLEFALPLMEIDLKKDEKDCMFHYYELQKL